MDGSQIRQLRLRHGLTQEEVARAGGLQQSDVSVVESGRRDSQVLRRRVVAAILRASSPSRVLELHRAEMREYLTAQGLDNIRLFGSAARGEDQWDSDLDIMARMPEGTSLVEVYEWEQALRRIGGGVRVDLVPETPESLSKLASSRGQMVAL